jgi:hypothetical protein
MLYIFISLSFNIYTVFCLLFGVCFCLCHHVDDVTFEEGQEQQYEEENQQFDEEGKWTSLPTCSILSQL